jgi:hypothetical protein
LAIAITRDIMAHSRGTHGGREPNI